MIGSFEFNNIKSTDLKLVCKSVNRPILPELRPRMTEIYGKSGLIDYGGGDYATRQITMHIGYIGTDYNELRTRTRSIAAWLMSASWAKLIINDETDKFYLARVIEGIDFETLYRVGEADIRFECQPFAYMVIDTGTDATWDSANFPWTIGMPWAMDNYMFSVSDTGGTFDFDNPGTTTIDYKSPQGSRSDIKIVGGWGSLEVRLNGKSLSFPPGTGELVIDNIDMTVMIDGENKLSAVGGDIDSFLPIIQGQNTLKVSGVDLNVDVYLEFRPQWL